MGSAFGTEGPVRRLVVLPGALTGVLYAAFLVLAEVGNMHHGLFQMGAVADLAHAYGLALLVLTHYEACKRRR